MSPSSPSLEVEFEATYTADSTLVTPAWLRSASPSSPATPPSSSPGASYLLQRLTLPHPRRVLSRTRTRGAAEAPHEAEARASGAEMQVLLQSYWETRPPYPIARSYFPASPASSFSSSSSLTLRPRRLHSHVASARHDQRRSCPPGATPTNHMGLPRLHAISKVAHEV
jgi:hypothetical protein